MDVIGIIPARYGSQRLEGKALADIGGKPMIQHVWEAARTALFLDDVLVATDDERIADACAKFGACAVMTSARHSCGTDRICEAAAATDARYVINIQGDEPLLKPVMIDMVARALLDDPAVVMATLVKRIEDEREIHDPHVVKVAVDAHGRALYFSRAAIPHRASTSEIARPAYFKHIGMYGYTKDFLFVYRDLPRTEWEQTEKLEQLRALHAGYAIKAVETRYDTIGVDTAEDLEKVRKIIGSTGGLS
jgi:3-deoxy-manno-octulosonate cytidylyltransferase (CMP-KDO synthetase)